MKIVADENLAFTEYFFGGFGQIEQRAGRLLTAKEVEDADALLVRSVTKVNAQLLDQSHIQFVGSATIGIDHLDTDYLAKKNIAWSNAAGCNAQAVAEYVITAILHVKPEALFLEQAFCLGIVGLGNVGTRLAKMAQLLGWRVVGCDPFVSRTEIEQTDLAALLAQSDAVSLHVPLTQATEHATYHLINAEALALMPRQSILINSSRGPVIEEQALIADIQRTQRPVVLDVFEHEPEISAELLQHLQLATPHIAGYSLEGKARGTQMIYQAFCEKYGFQASKTFESQLSPVAQYFEARSVKEALQQYLSQIYDITQDDANLRACLKEGKVDQTAFDYLRKTYPLRREWSAHGGPQA